MWPNQKLKNKEGDINLEEWKDSFVILFLSNSFKFFHQRVRSTHNEFLFHAELNHAFEIILLSELFTLFNPNPSKFSTPKMYFVDSKYSDKNYLAVVRTSAP